MPRLKDLTGMKFGKLTVLRKGENAYTSGGNSSVRWVCFCECDPNREILVKAGNLLKGGTKSCGCYNRERTITFNKETKSKYNTYDLTGEYGIGYTSKGEEFYFDLEDYDLIKDYCWFLHKGYRDKLPYVSARFRGDNGLDKHIRLHRLIMNPSDDEQIDHKDINPSNNRKENLRICFNQQNSWNKGKKDSNTSGFIGVRKENDKWVARIRCTKQIFIGKFNKLEEAIMARLRAEKEYFGEFAPQRYLFEQYNIL